MSKIKSAYAILFALALSAGCQKSEVADAEAPLDAAADQNAAAETTPSALEGGDNTDPAADAAPTADAGADAPQDGDAAQVPALELDTAPAANPPAGGGLQLQLGGQGGGFGGNQPRLNLNRSF